MGCSNASSESLGDMSGSSQSSSNDSSILYGEKSEGMVKIESILSRIREKMKNELKMQEIQVDESDIFLPSNNCTSSKCSIFATVNFMEVARLLVIIPYREAGIWSRSICLNGETKAGSMLMYIRKAISENYGVLIMNPAASSVAANKHVRKIWQEYVIPSKGDLFLLAYSRGCQLVKDLLNHDNGSGIVQNRLRALALVEPSHKVAPTDKYFTRRILSRRAVAWLLSGESRIGEKIPYGEPLYGCICISAGFVSASCSGSSGGWALEYVLSSVFGSFAARCGRAVGITKSLSISCCSVCRKKLGYLNRKITCSWCQVVVCFYCSSDIFVKSYGMNRLCSICLSLPCLVAPRNVFNEVRNTTKQEAYCETRISTAYLSTPDEMSKGLSLMDFEIIKMIGRGACGRVKLVRKRAGLDEGALYAMKAIKKKLVVQRGLVNATNAERRILHSIQHPYIARLRYAFQSESKLYLLTDYYPGGNLLDQMRKVRRFDEDRAKLYAAQVSLALAHLHNNNIMYRDLKLENVLCDSEGHIALTDFGMSKENVSFGDKANTFVGTYQMMAPDILKGQPYSVAVDWWALGVMVYEMIEGKTPFNGKTNSVIKQKILSLEISYTERFSPSARDFVASLLSRDPDDRLGVGVNGIQDIQNHPWLRDLDWDAISNRRLLFSNQKELMKTHAKEYRTSDIFDTYMHSMEVALDTPVSVGGEASDLFRRFSFSFMNDEEENPLK